MKCIKNTGTDAGPKMSGIEEGLQGVLIAPLCCKIFSVRSYHANYRNVCAQFARVIGRKQTSIIITSNLLFP